MIKESNFRRMATEVLAIVDLYPKSTRDKIPTQLIEELQRNKLPDLKVNLDKNKKLHEQDICEESLVMTYMIYRSYIASPEEQVLFDKILNKFDEETRKKYDPNNIFKKKDENTSNAGQSTDSHSER